MITLPLSLHHLALTYQLLPAHIVRNLLDIPYLGSSTNALLFPEPAYALHSKYRNQYMASISPPTILKRHKKNSISIFPVGTSFSFPCKYQSIVL